MPDKPRDIVVIAEWGSPSDPNDWLADGKSVVNGSIRNIRVFGHALSGDQLKGQTGQ